MAKYLKIVAGIVLFVVFAILMGRFLPTPVFYSDFMCLYHALLAWSKGFSFYDFAQQQKLMFETTQFSQPQFNIQLFQYFPYPPWYAGFTFFLLWLPYDWAYHTWTIINVGLLVLSANLLSARQNPRIRPLAVAAAIFYFPSLGLIVVGNYTLPVLLGGALFIYAARKEESILAAVGIALMTFKPHIGIFMALFAFGWLWLQKTVFARNARWMSIIAGLILGLIGFMIEPQWIISFPRSIYLFQTSSYMHACTYCISLSNILMGLVNSQANPNSSGLLSLLLLAIALILVWLRRTDVFSSVEKMMSVAVALTAVGLSYMVHYDFVILLIPLLLLFFREKNSKARFLYILLYLLPWLRIFSDLTGNIILTLTGIAIFARLLLPDDFLKRLSQSKA